MSVYSNCLKIRDLTLESAKSGMMDRSRLGLGNSAFNVELINSWIPNAKIFWIAKLLRRQRVCENCSLFNFNSFLPICWHISKGFIRTLMKSGNCLPAAFQKGLWVISEKCIIVSKEEELHFALFKEFENMEVFGGTCLFQYINKGRVKKITARGPSSNLDLSDNITSSPL